MKSTLVWTFLLALLGSSAASAEVYVWKDEAGKTVYSDQPPPSANARRMNTRAPSPASAPAPAKESKKAMGKDASGENAKIAAENAKVAEANAKIREQNCQNARNQLASVQTNSRIRMPGSNALATDAQRNELIAQAQANVQTWCGK
ncbi:DUF4124 domain-containing protein [Chromobacterium haemolyticum]|uniref:DUF4124 domain-containing protein n=1 Tax=Chromobacterium haemolyticum TaxID=394935 RepID=UPI001315B1DC|nr:DUF4124 domain-containing protein [Chromobacterium haemolyticum]BBH14202.1 hypothetical protein CH06BL_34500 [Chromobacterium haemolyticum]